VSIHLVGGGFREDDEGEIYATFVAEAADRASVSGRTFARIAVLVVGVDEESAMRSGNSWARQLARVGPCDAVVTAIVEGDLFESSVLSEIDAVLVAGGLTPAYLDAVTPLIDEIRLLVGDGLPYLGFSAGAAIAADTAIIGGWKIEGIPVGSEETGEDLDEVTVVEGLGLIELSVDVHAAQWGTLARIIAATEAGLIEGGVAIDEFTVLILGDDSVRVVGAGNAWRIFQHDDGVLVSTILP
jgi:cyanophycinase